MCTGHGPSRPHLEITLVDGDPEVEQRKLDAAARSRRRPGCGADFRAISAARPAEVILGIEEVDHGDDTPEPDPAFTGAPVPRGEPANAWRAAIRRQARRFEAVAPASRAEVEAVEPPHASALVVAHAAPWWRRAIRWLRALVGLPVARGVDAAALADMRKRMGGTGSPRWKARRL